MTLLKPSKLVMHPAREIIDKTQVLSEHPKLGRTIAGRPEYRQIVLQVLGAAYVFQHRFDGTRL